MTRNTEEELARMREVNLTLRRQLERSRRDALLYAAQVCGDHHMVWTEGDGWGLVLSDEGNHGGRAYAAKLREIAG
jgi:hypothetical protein